MAEAFPAGQTQTAETSSGERAASPELSILLFNVSGKDTQKGTSASQCEGIAHVLDSEELAVDSSSLCILCTDNVSTPKKKVFYQRLGSHLPQRKSEDAAIFFNKMVASDFKLKRLPSLSFRILVYMDIHQKLRTHLERAKGSFKQLRTQMRFLIAQLPTTPTTRFLGKLQSLTKAVETAQERVQRSLLTDAALSSSLLKSPSVKHSVQYIDECLGRVSIATVTSLLNDKQSKKIMLVSWHGPHSGKSNPLKENYLEMVIVLVDQLRVLQSQDVAVIGGDFNCPDSRAEVVVSKISKVPGIRVLKSDDRLMYVVFWPECHLEILPYFPKLVLPDTPKEVFDHKTVLYRFRIKYPDQRHGDKDGGDEDERKGEERARGRGYEEGWERHGAEGIAGGVAGKETGEMMATAGADIPGQEQTSDSDIRRLAETLLKEGRMPLLQPAKRRWERDEQVRLPGGTRWPPRDYQSKSPEEKLQLTERAIGIMTGNSPKPNCKDVQDEWGMLLLHLTDFTSAKHPTQKARDDLFAVVKCVALGEDCSPEGEGTVRALSFLPKPEGVVAEVTELIRDVPLRLGL